MFWLSAPVVASRVYKELDWVVEEWEERKIEIGGVEVQGTILGSMARGRVWVAYTLEAFLILQVVY